MFLNETQKRMSSPAKEFFVSIQNEVQLSPRQEKSVQAKVADPTAPGDSTVDDFIVGKFFPFEQAPKANSAVWYLHLRE